MTFFSLGPRAPSRINRSSRPPWREQNKPGLGGLPRRKRSSGANPEISKKSQNSRVRSATTSRLGSNMWESPRTVARRAHSERARRASLSSRRCCRSSLDPRSRARVASRRLARVASRARPPRFARAGARATPDRRRPLRGARRSSRARRPRPGLARHGVRDDHRRRRPRGERRRRRGHRRRGVRVRRRLRRRLRRGGSRRARAPELRVERPRVGSAREDLLRRRRGAHLQQHPVRVLPLRPRRPARPPAFLSCETGELLVMLSGVLLGAFDFGPQCGEADPRRTQGARQLHREAEAGGGGLPRPGPPQDRLRRHRPRPSRRARAADAGLAPQVRGHRRGAARAQRLRGKLRPDVRRRRASPRRCRRTSARSSPSSTEPWRSWPSPSHTEPSTTRRTSRSLPRFCSSRAPSTSRLGKNSCGKNEHHEKNDKKRSGVAPRCASVDAAEADTTPIREGERVRETNRPTR